MQFLHFIKKTLSLDVRSLSLFRILVGLLVMADVISRWPDLVDFYTDLGLVPRNIFISEMSVPWSFSLHLANGSYGFAIFMFSVQFIFGFMVFIGYKTRFAIIGAFIMAVSVHNRNWLLNNGGDDVLRVILFLSIFLPLNRFFSVDSAMQTESEKNKDHFSTWGLTFYFQVFAIYFVSYIFKDHPIWRFDYTAFFFSSRLDIFATPLGIWLRNFPTFGRIVTILSISLEWFGPLILLMTFIFGRFWWIVRMLLIVTFIGFHFGIFLAMNIGLFTFICMAMWTIFLPGEFWERCSLFFKRKKSHKITIHFNQCSGFCEKTVRIFKSFFLMEEVILEPVKRESYKYEEMLMNQSWIIVSKNEKYFVGFYAWVELMKDSPCFSFFEPMFSFRPISFVGNKISNWVFYNIELLDTLSNFLNVKTSPKPIRPLIWIYQLLGIFFLITIFMWNLTTIKKFDFNAPFFQNIARWTHLYQEWNLFSPHPKLDNIWIEIPAELSDGSNIELMSGDRDIYSIKKDAFNKSITNDHWRKFYLNVSDKVDYARYLGSFLCRRWNDRHIRLVKETNLKSLQINVYSQINLPDGDKGGINQKLSWKHWCFEEDYKKENQPFLYK